MNESIFRKVVRDVLKFRLESGLAYVSAGNFAATILGALLWLLLGTVVIKEEYGLLNYLLATSTIAASAGIAGLNLTVTTFVAKKDETIHAQSNFLALILSTSSALIIMLVTNNPILSLLVVTAVFFQMSTSELLGRQRYKEYMIVAAGQKTLLLACAFGMYYLFGVTGVLLSFALAWGISSYRYLLSWRKPSLSFSSLKSKIKFVVNNSISNIAIALTFSFDKLLIGPLFGFGNLGIYQFGLQFLMFGSVLPGILFSYLLPETAANNRRTNTILLGLTISVVIAISFVAFSPWLINTFFPNFTESIVLAQIMTIGIIPLTIISIANSKLLAREDSKIVLLSALTFLSSQSLLVIILGEILGLIGLAVATLSALFAQATFVTVSWLWQKRGTVSI